MSFKNLRTLAPKSIMLFGKFADCTVDQLMVLNRHVYLRWVYYNCSMISFNEHILECLDITDKWRIDKPGTDPEMCDRLKKFKDSKPLGSYKMRSDARNKKRKQIAQFRRDYAGRYVESKSQMQARNQNKYKRS